MKNFLKELNECIKMMIAVIKYSYVNAYNNSYINSSINTATKKYEGGNFFVAQQYLNTAEKKLDSLRRESKIDNTFYMENLNRIYDLRNKMH